MAAAVGSASVKAGRAGWLASMLHARATTQREEADRQAPAQKRAETDTRKHTPPKSVTCPGLAWSSTWSSGQPRPPVQSSATRLTTASAGQTPCHARDHLLLLRTLRYPSPRRLVPSRIFQGHRWADSPAHALTRTRTPATPAHAPPPQSRPRHATLLL